MSKVTKAAETSHEGEHGKHESQDKATGLDSNPRFHSSWSSDLGQFDTVYSFYSILLPCLEREFNDVNGMILT